MRQNTSFDKRDHRAIKYSGTRQRRILLRNLIYHRLLISSKLFSKSGKKKPTFFAGSAVLDCAYISSSCIQKAYNFISFFLSLKSWWHSFFLRKIFHRMNEAPASPSVASAGRFRRLLLLVASVGRFRWSLPSVATVGRFRRLLLLVATVGRFRRSLPLVAPVGCYCWSLLLVASAGRFRWSLLLVASGERRKTSFSSAPFFVILVNFSPWHRPPNLLWSESRFSPQFPRAWDWPVPPRR